MSMENQDLVSRLKRHEPYKTLWNRGKGYEKIWCERDILYVWYLTSKEKDNPYRNLSPSIRVRELQSDLFSDKYPSDPIVENAIKRAREFERLPEENLVEAATDVAHKLTEYFDKVDFTQTTQSGAMTYDPLQVMNMLKQVGAVVRSLSDLREQMSKSQSGKEKIYGGGDKGDYEE